MKKNRLRQITILILIAGFFSCSQTTPKVNSYPEIFENAFLKNAVASMDSLNCTFYSVTIGNLKVESGKIIACDPIVVDDGVAFTQAFPQGEFPVQLAIAKIENDERVAFSRILFSNDAISKWEFALQPGQKSIPITEENIYCYSVDAGIGLFIDEETNKYFKQKNYSVYGQPFVNSLTRNNRDTWTYAFDEFEGHNLIAFSTGYGDGCYATYIGFDSNGKVCQLLTDFGLIKWWTKN